VIGLPIGVGRAKTGFRFALARPIFGPGKALELGMDEPIREGKDQVAVVQRIVPGKLVYVELSPEEVYAVRLNTILIRNGDGSYAHYRGEPLADLGLDSGRRVVVWTDKPGLAPRNLVVQSKPASRSLFGYKIR
jgi:hypothetical protein